MDRIKQISIYAHYGISAWLVAIPVFYALFWMLIDVPILKELVQGCILAKPIATPEGIIQLSNVAWGSASKIIGFFASTIGVVPLMLGLNFLRKILCNYARGDVFTSTNSMTYHKIAWLFFLDALIAMPISDGLMITATTLTNAPGHRYFSLSFGTPNLSTILFGCLAIILSWVMIEASKIADDQKLVI